MKRGYADIPGGQMHFRVAGKGKPLLLLHQVPSWSTEYGALIPLLAPHFRVYAPDALGYGMSDKPASVHSIEDYAADILAFTKAEGISSCGIFGHHTGASVAVEVAAAYPTLVAGMVLSGCPHYTEEMRRARLADGAFDPPQVKADASHVTDAWNLMRRYIPDASPEILNDMLIGRLLAGPRGEEGHHAVFAYEIEKRLPRISCPTLLFSTTGDTFIDRIEETARLVPGVQVKTALGGGLAPNTAAELLAGLMLEFFKPD